MATSKILKGTDFQVYLVLLFIGYLSLSLHNNVLLEQVDTTAMKRSYYNN